MSIFTVNRMPSVLFGVGSFEQTGEKMKGLGCTKALCICDPAMISLGFYDKLKAILDASGIGAVVYDGVAGEPKSSMVNAAAKLGRDENVDSIIGFGGGSCLDTAKATNMVLSNGGFLEDYIGKNIANQRNIVKKFPMILMTTTSGTSAEVTPMFVITDENTGLKTGGILKGTDLAIIDPQFTYGLPPFVTATTGIDMLAHATESYTNPKTHYMADFLNEKAIALIFENLPKVVADGKNLEAREKMSFAGVLTGFAFTDNGTHIGHAIADGISFELHLAHGVGCSLGLMATIKYVSKMNPEKTRNLAKIIGIEGADSMSDEVVGEAVLEAYRTLERSIGLKRMKDIGVTKEIIDHVMELLPNNPRFKNNPLAPDFAVLAKLLAEEFEAN